MVEITKNEKETVFEVKGLHKVWAFKSELRIPNSHILKAYCDENEINEWKGIRALGTYIPSVIKAGTFYQDKDSSAIFMDIGNPKNAIIVDLKDEEYKKLIIEVSNPQDAITLLTENANA